MVARRRRSYRGQPQSPLVANAHPGGVHGISELLRRVGSQKRLSPAAERVEDEGNLEPMAGAEESVELR